MIDVISVAEAFERRERLCTITACSKRASGGPLGAARGAPECRLVVFAGTVSATERGVYYTPVIQSFISHLISLAMK
jgi:hypothetical protein